MCEDSVEITDSEYVEDNLSIMSSTLGVFMLGVLAAIIGLFYANFAWNFILVDEIMFDCFEILFGAAVLVLGCIALRSGQTTEGIVMAVFGIYALFFGIVFGSSLIFPGYPEGIHIMGILLGIGLLAAACIRIMTRDILFGIASLLLALSLFINIFDVEVTWIVSGLMTLVAGAIFIYYAIGNWIYVETGRDFLPII